MQNDKKTEYQVSAINRNTMSNTSGHRDKQASGNLYKVDGVCEGTSCHQKQLGSALEEPEQS